MLVPTPLGDLMIEAEAGKIVTSRFVKHRASTALCHGGPSTALLTQRAQDKLRERSRSILLEAKRQVNAYFARELTRFSLPLTLEGKEFERAAWGCVAALHFGEFVSYADVARAIGRPLSHRGVARAMANAPLDLFVPAHRVVGADGRPRGTSSKSLRSRLIAFERGNILNMAVKRKTKYWSKRVTERSDALDIERDVFTKRSPREIALSLKRSAEHSTRRRAQPYQSAMSMLNFYINRAGKNLPESRKRVLERAKDELRTVFGREPRQK
jgi:O-6-methylguanine DNA methyltransferase